MDPVLPPGPEWLRRRQLVEERKVADLERRLRAPSVRSLADLDDTAIDYLSEPPEDGDTLVFDESLATDLSPAGRWRPGAGGGGGGGEFSSLILGMYEDLSPWVVSSGESNPGLALGVINSGGSRGIGVSAAGVYAATASLWADDSAGEVMVRLIAAAVDGPGGQCLHQTVSDTGQVSASVAADFACPEWSSILVSVDAPGASYWDLHMTVHLVHQAPILAGICDD